MEWWRLYRSICFACLSSSHSLHVFTISSTGWDLHVNIWTRHLQKENEALVLNLILFASFCSLCWRLYSWNNVSIGKDCCCCLIYRLSSCCLLYCSSWRFPTPSKFSRRRSLQFPAANPAYPPVTLHLTAPDHGMSLNSLILISEKITLIKISQ